MSTIILVCFVVYTCLLFLVTWLTSRKASNDTYFRGNRKSPWYVVAYGMIGHRSDRQWQMSGDRRQRSELH